MSILSRLLRRTVRPAPRAIRPRAAVETIEVLVEEEQQLGCGWFDSSHELHRGLWVREHDAPGAVAAGLPLGSWLELQLAGWQPRT